MSLHTLTKTQSLPTNIDTAWEFISSPLNLKKITPKHMGFEITSDYRNEKMYPGMIISYKVSPILNISMNWVTEITHVEDKKYFVDEQRFGPYSFWHHKHFISSIEGGVLMTDIIHYKVPMGFIGDLMNSILVKKQLEDIFDYRFKALVQLFGKMN